MRFHSVLFMACLLAMASCNNTPATPAAAAVSKAPAKSKLDEEGTKKVLATVSAYYTLKNAMVAARAGDAANAATQLAMATDSLQAYLQKDSANMTALKPYTDTILTQCKLAGTINDPTCEKQRLVFGPISSAMYGLLKKADLKNAGIYHEYCPMAFNEKGGTWLSRESDIKNPYFGKKMLECGEVTDSL